MTEPPGHLNSRPLLDECVIALSRDNSWESPARAHAISVITVLRRRGLLNDAGVEIVRAEMGDRK